MQIWPLEVLFYAIFRCVDFYDRTVEKIQIIKCRKKAVRTTLKLCRAAWSETFGFDGLCGRAAYSLIFTDFDSFCWIVSFRYDLF